MNFVEKKRPQRPKTAKKYETMHYLSPTKSTLALDPCKVNLHPSFQPQSLKVTSSVKNLKTSKALKSLGLRQKDVRVRRKRKFKGVRRKSMDDIR